MRTPSGESAADAPRVMSVSGDSVAAFLHAEPPAGRFPSSRLARGLLSPPAMRETLRRILRSRGVWLALGLLLSAYLLVGWVESVGGPEAIRARYGVLAPAITSSIQILVAPTPFPSDVICVAQGALYGFWLALGLNWLGWWLAAHLEFLLGRRLRGDFDIELQLKRLPHWLSRFPVHHPVFLIFARQVPWAGGHLTTLVPGAMGVPFLRSAWCNAIGIIPGATLTAGIGAGLLAL